MNTDRYIRWLESDIIDLHRIANELTLYVSEDKDIGDQIERLYKIGLRYELITDLADESDSY